MSKFMCTLTTVFRPIALVKANDAQSLRLTKGMLGVRSSVGSIVIGRHRSAPAAVVVYFEASFELPEHVDSTEPDREEEV